MPGDIVFSDKAINDGLKVDQSLALSEALEHTVSTDILHSSFKGEFIENIQTYEYSDSMATAKVEEWFFCDGLAFLMMLI